MGCQTEAFPEAARQAFISIKDLLTKIVLLTHSDPSTSISLITDASNTALGAVFRQYTNVSWKPLVFVFKRLQPAGSRCSPFREKLFAFCPAVRHFRDAFEDGPFKVFTDHKPLVRALHPVSDRYSPHEIRRLDFVSHFIVDIGHAPGADYSAAESLPCKNPVSFVSNTKQRPQCNGTGPFG